MPEGIGYSGVAAKADTVRTQQTLTRAEQNKVTQARDQRPPEPVSRKDPAVEVKLSDQASKAEAGVQPRQEVDTYEALNRKS